MNYDRTLDPDATSEAVREIQPSWEVLDATPAEHGHHIVYLLTVETGSGPRRAVLKATPDGKTPVCGSEARMQAILDAHTSIPVPRVYGVVDEHDSLPSPFLLQSHLDGTTFRGDVIREASESEIERLAYTTGRYLGELHALDAVDAFGFVRVEAAEPLAGRSPSSDLGRIVVDDWTESWEEYLRRSVSRLVDGLGETRFTDERDRIETIADAHVADLTGAFDPVIARIDNSIDNLLLDPETYAVTGMLDWEFCVAATPAYDLAFVVHSLVDGFWSMLPDAPSHREAAQTSLLEGYRETGSSRAIDQFRANRECYDLLANLHAMRNFDDWFDLVGIDDERREHAADRLRSRVRSYDRND